jgi:hypothetical protein
MNQSTIYRRHEARLARTHALRDDPRSAFLRVLSGLPLTRIIVPAYQKDEGERQNQSQTLIGKSSTHNLGDYSEETVFSIADETVVNENNNSRGISSSSNTMPQHALQTLLAVGVGAAMGESLFGGHYCGRRFTSPFSHHPQHHNKILAHSPFTVQGHTANPSLTFQLRKSQRHTRPIAATIATTTTKPSTTIFVAASTISLMFGTKVVAVEYLSQSSGNSGDPATSIISSALAGSLTGIVRLGCISAQTNLRQSLPSILKMTPHTISVSSPMPLLGRHVAGATLYFATYDILASDCSTATTIEKTTPRILVAGATAGMVHALMLQSTSNTSIIRLLPAVVRAAPIHALVFYTYESMRQGMKKLQPTQVIVKPLI